MSMQDVDRIMVHPKTMIASDGGVMAPGDNSPHPRNYGTFARVLGKYVRDEKVLSMEEAIRKLAALPSRNLRIDRRGELKEGYFADVVVFDPDTPEVFATAERIRNEYVLKVTGKVRPRPEGTENPELATGQVEVLGLRLEVLNESETPPFQLDDIDVNEETRLRYRYIDLRRPEMQARLRLRSQITQALRSFLDAHL